MKRIDAPTTQFSRESDGTMSMSLSFFQETADKSSKRQIIIPKIILDDFEISINKAPEYKYNQNQQLIMSPMHLDEIKFEIRDGTKGTPMEVIAVRKAMTQKEIEEALGYEIRIVPEGY